MIGQKFNRLTVVSLAFTRNYGGGVTKKYWNCICDCGGHKIGETARLVGNFTKSCGCLRQVRADRVSEEAAAKFWDRKIVNPETGCWEFTGSLINGYGNLSYKKKSWRAHRLAYHLTHNGIPEGLDILHTCDNKKCFNPKHLYAGTDLDNAKDIKDRGLRIGINAGEENGRAKLTQEQADKIRSLYSSGHYSQSAIGVMFGVSQFAVSQIILNKRYVK